MEFNKKLQELRKQKELTQEQLADLLFVSRTAVSKWESGRGYPNIESLKAIAKIFSVSIDALLSGEELLTVAEEDHKEKQSRSRDLLFGLLDICVAMLLFLPFFARRTNGEVQAVSLIALTGAKTYLRIAYYSIVVLTILVGTLTLAMQNSKHGFWLRVICGISLVCNFVAIVLFIVGLQPYAAVFLFVLLLIKILLLVKK